ncbi:hypothetical protein [Bradyrhizobium sp. URHD0069]|uniref:hypothetical protein n=1 Tax=Bradyrhizobium sp. URHD0069 TaxID=1380355 RepID=UPI00049693B4|nr:hypothetical protein [Bradyrhizobium sp. URHD0069]
MSTHNPYANAYPVGGRSWTIEEDQALLAMMREGKRNQQIADKINRTIHAVKSRYRYLGLSVEERASLRRMKRLAQPPVIRMKIDHVTDRAPVIPLEVLEDRARRYTAQRDLTAIICGDPEPGRVRL